MNTRLQTIPRDEFFRRMEEILKMPAGALQGPEPLREAKDWDSLAMLEFIAMVDSRLGMTVGVESILASDTFNDLYALIEH